MTAALRVRGQPLVALVAVLAGWLAGRVVNWEPHIPSGYAAAETGAATSGRSAQVARTPVTTLSPPGALGRLEIDAAGERSVPEGGGIGLASLETAEGIKIAVPLDWLLEVLANKNSAVANGAARHGARLVSDRVSERQKRVSGLGEELAYNSLHDGRGRPFSVPKEVGAGFSPDPGMPAGFAPGRARDATAARSAMTDLTDLSAGPRQRRWSGDAWALLRSGTGGAVAPGALPATYGASQAGAVLRYALSSRSSLVPSAYLRSTSAMGGTGETALALGLSARPLARIPLIAAGELRVTEQAGKRRLQPALMAVSQLPPIELPRKAQLEAYVQAGYVAGAYSTPFVDGQVRADREVLRFDRVSARLGGGVWGGAQRDAARVDAGPSASVTMPLAKGAYGRLGVDWRFRIAGEAQPDTGPALTLSAGF